jgi:signal peptidase I
MRTLRNLLDAFRARRARRRVEAEARHLVSEARRILKKKSAEIPAAVASEIEDAISAVHTTLGSPELEPVRQAVSTLDEKMNQHLAFARKSTVREYSESIVVAVAIALLLRAFVIEAFQIPSGSMIPTLEIGDHIFVSKFAYGIGIPFTNKKILSIKEPRRGDVIVFKYPLGPETDYIKRVVGLPGDKVEVRRNEIFINGKPMPRELVEGGPPCRYSEGPRFDGTPIEKACELWMETLDGHVHKAIHEPDHPASEFGPKEIPPNNVFVMGDNRDNSNDSRVWGTVPYELIKGKALIIWWSRGPTSGEWSGRGLGEWFRAIRWRRFFHLVD